MCPDSRYSRLDHCPRLRRAHAHAVIDPDYPGSDVEPVLRRLRKIASRDFGIQHITIQVEQSRDGCTEHHHVDHVIAGERPAEA